MSAFREDTCPASPGITSTVSGSPLGLTVAVAVSVILVTIMAPVPGRRRGVTGLPGSSAYLDGIRFSRRTRQVIVAHPLPLRIPPTALRGPRSRAREVELNLPASTPTSVHLRSPAAAATTSALVVPVPVPIPVLGTAAGSRASAPEPIVLVIFGVLELPLTSLQAVTLFTLALLANFHWCGEPKSVCKRRSGLPITESPFGRARSGSRGLR